MHEEHPQPEVTKEVMTILIITMLPIVASV